MPFVRSVLSGPTTALNATPRMTDHLRPLPFCFSTPLVAGAPLTPDSPFCFQRTPLASAWPSDPRMPPLTSGLITSGMASTRPASDQKIHALDLSLETMNRSYDRLAKREVVTPPDTTPVIQVKVEQVVDDVKDFKDDRMLLEESDSAQEGPLDLSLGSGERDMARINNSHPSYKKTILQRYSKCRSRSMVCIALYKNYCCYYYYRSFI